MRLRNVTIVWKSNSLVPEIGNTAYNNTVIQYHTVYEGYTLQDNVYSPF